MPEDAQVTAEVVIDNKDIGFVSEGQAAEIKLETFQLHALWDGAAQVRA